MQFHTMFAAVGLFAVASSASVALHHDAQQTDLIPRSIFFGNPDRAAVEISPDGTKLAWLAPHEEVMNVWVQTIGQDDARPVTKSKERPIRVYFWAQNGEQIIYAQDRGGDENFRLYAVNLGGGDEIALTPFDAVQARILATDQNFPDEILAAVNNRIPQLHDVWRINTRTGKGEAVYLNNEGWAGFTADANFTIRLALRFRPDGGTDAFHRTTNDDQWERFATWSMEDTANSGPLGFARDGKTLYVRDARDRDTSALYSLTFEEGQEPKRTLIAENPKADMAGGVGHPETGRIQAVSFNHARVEWTILDEAIKGDWEYLRTVADGDFSISSRSNDDRMWTIAYLVDNGPVRYYLYDRSTPRKRAKFLFTNRANLEGLPLSPMKPVIIPSRDGLELVSYLTLPHGAPSSDGTIQPVRGPHPMVLLVHGGPWARDSWGYNPIHQWLANRGYAVLSVNFRGSTGFGKAFMNAGNREWAGKMHDDLIDAVNWAVDRGVADRDKVAIMGGSYGGYATLVGLTFTPDVFAAGVDIVGPSHVGTLLQTIPPYWEPIKVMFEKRVGSLSEPEYLDSISPLTKVDAIRKPLLIGQGANDPRVKESESIQIVEAMQERNIPVTYVVFPDEGHGFARPENSMAFWAVTEVFLAQHLGGRFQEIGSDVRQSTAKIPAGAALVPGLAEAK